MGRGSSVSLSRMIHSRKAELFVAVGSFVVAAALSFVGQYLSIQGDVKGGTVMLVAQFLTLSATIFGIDYKFGGHHG